MSTALRGFLTAISVGADVRQALTVASVEPGSLQEQVIEAQTAIDQGIETSRALGMITRWPPEVAYLIGRAAPERRGRVAQLLANAYVGRRSTMTEFIGTVRSSTGLSIVGINTMVCLSIVALWKVFLPDYAAQSSSAVAWPWITLSAQAVSGLLAAVTLFRSLPKRGPTSPSMLARGLHAVGAAVEVDSNAQQILDIFDSAARSKSFRTESAPLKASDRRANSAPPRWMQEHRGLPDSIALIASYRWAGEAPSAPWTRAAAVAAQQPAPSSAEGLMFLSIALCAVGVCSMVLGIWHSVFMIAESIV